MFRRNGSVTQTVSDAAESVAEYVDPLAHDEKLRQRIAGAVAAGLAARRQAQRHLGLRGLAFQLGTDPVLRAQLAELADQLQGARKRARKAHSHKVRNALLLVGGAGLVVAAVPSLRDTVLSKLRRRDDWAPSEWTNTPTSTPTTIEEQIEVGVPVSTAYNQWTQFEEFPRFMDGIDEVRQLDDTLLHWAATVAGKHAEWDAKIVEQEPDRVISWESVDGKRTRGTVRFEEAGPNRTRLRINLSYTPDGATEKVGSAMGLDSRRVRGDLERFRELIEKQGVETGAWRGEVKDGIETPKGSE